MKKGLPKAQKGLAKLAKIVKTASKTSGNTTKGAKPIVRKAKRISDAQKSLSASALSGMTASQLRLKLSSLMQEASAASKAKAKGSKRLAFKQKGGSIGGKLSKAQTGQVIGGARKFADTIKKGPGILPPGFGDKGKIKKEWVKGSGLGPTPVMADTDSFKKKAKSVRDKMQNGGVVGTKKKKTPSELKSYLSKPSKRTTTRPKSLTGKPPVPKEATSRRARKISGKMLSSVTGKTPPRSKRQLLKRKPGMGAILPKKMTRKRG